MDSWNRAGREAARLSQQTKKGLDRHARSPRQKAVAQSPLAEGPPCPNVSFVQLRSAASISKMAAKSQIPKQQHLVMRLFFGEDLSVQSSVIIASRISSRNRLLSQDGHLTSHYPYFFTAFLIAGSAFFRSLSVITGMISTLAWKA